MILRKNMILSFFWVTITLLLYLQNTDGRFLSLTEGVERLQRVSTGEGGKLQCGYVDVRSKYASNCKRSYLSDIFDKGSDRGVHTGRQLLQEISTVCGKYDSYRRCANCTAKHDCPEQRAELFESLMGKWSIFCEKDQVSDWLQKVLQNGYRYNQSCEDAVITHFFSCYEKLFSIPEFDFNTTAFEQMSLSEGIDYHRSFLSAAFKCVIGEILELSEFWRLECGSTWQDVLLQQLLSISASPNVGFNVYQDEIDMLQEMRC